MAPRSRFLQVHFLTSYHASLLNRDDTGLAKRVTFGGIPRLRVSSQSQKRHWSTWMTERTDLPTSVRSRYVFSRAIRDGLAKRGVDQDLATRLVHELASEVLHSAGEDGPVDKNLMLAQPLLFGRPEVEYLSGLVERSLARVREAHGDSVEADEAAIKDVSAELKAALKAEKKNLDVMVREAGGASPAVGLQGALFGRFITSDIPGSRVDGPVHVAHAFTTHAVENEVDYFTVVDDLARDEETGAAHVNESDLGAGIFYGYVVVDLPLLVSNLTGCDPEEWSAAEIGSAGDVLGSLLTAVAQVSPGAKLGSTAPYARADFFMVEAGAEQPRSLANAFLRSVEVRSRDQSLMAESVAALARYLGALDAMYGRDSSTRYVATTQDWPGQPSLPFSEVVQAGIRDVLGGASSGATSDQ